MTIGVGGAGQVWEPVRRAEGRNLAELWECVLPAQEGKRCA